MLNKIWSSRIFRVFKFLIIAPRTQTSIEINVPTIPTAARDSVAFTSILPTIAVSVIDRIGSDTPDIKAGIASLLICRRLMLVVN